MPYVQYLSEKINKIVEPYNYKITHKNTNNLKLLYTNLKTKQTKNKTSHVVYKIPCNDCSKVYIGETKQYLEERIKGHKYANNLTALKKHTLNANHTFNFDNTEILEKEHNTKARCILEMIQIKTHTNAVNDKTDINNLSKIYNLII